MFRLEHDENSRSSLFHESIVTRMKQERGGGGGGNEGHEKGGNNRVGRVNIATSSVTRLEAG